MLDGARREPIEMGTLLTLLSPALVLFIALMLLYAFFIGFNNSGTLVAAPPFSLARRLRRRLAKILSTPT
ncbi:MAG: hypothetical protein DCC52_11925 [Chloroflexi bacterium]|nr:MAG: hypothetical protein DCC52_11925 [Chloroflexota bacterium]